MQGVPLRLAGCKMESDAFPELIVPPGHFTTDVHAADGKADPLSPPKRLLPFLPTGSQGIGVKMGNELLPAPASIANGGDAELGDALLRDTELGDAELGDALLRDAELGDN